MSFIQNVLYLDSLYRVYWNFFYCLAITVQFQPAAYSVNEGETVDFMIFLSSASISEVTVDFATGAGTALGKKKTSLKLACTHILTCLLSIVFLQLVVIILAFLKPSHLLLESSVKLSQ